MSTAGQIEQWRVRGSPVARGQTPSAPVSAPGRFLETILQNLRERSQGAHRRYLSNGPNRKVRHADLFKQGTNCQYHHGKNRREDQRNKVPDDVAMRVEAEPGILPPVAVAQ